MRALPPLAVVLILASIGLVACGDGEDGGDEAVDTGSPRSGAQDLNRFLMRKDEEPGFRPVGQPGTDTGVEAFVNGGGLTRSDARRLRSEGFISFTYQPIEGPRTAGVTNVALYETAEGAKHSMAHDLRTSVIRTAGDTSRRSPWRSRTPPRPRRGGSPVNRCSRRVGPGRARLPRRSRSARRCDARGR